MFFTALSVIFFELSPLVDVDVSQALYVFHHDQESPVYKTLLYIFRRLNFLFLYGSFGWLLFKLWQGYRHSKRQQVKKAFYVLGCLLVAGSVVSDLGIKPYFKRSRPGKILNFSEFYTPPFVVGTECKSNCSFVSGEVAVATAFTAFWVFMTRLRWAWILGSAVWVLLISGVRLAQIGHYLSDVVFAILVSLLILEIGRLLFGFSFSRKE